MWRQVKFRFMRVCLGLSMNYLQKSDHELDNSHLTTATREKAQIARHTASEDKPIEDRFGKA